MSDVDFKYFPDVFGEVVTEVRKEYDLVNNIEPYYEFGTYLELLSQCTVKDNNQVEKYPLIWLVWDAPDNIQKYIEPNIYNTSPRVFICGLTGKDLSTSERYTQTLKASLYPIFELLLSELGYHKNVELNSDFRYTVNDHPFWLNEDKAPFDILSSIEVKFENLTLLK